MEPGEFVIPQKLEELFSFSDDRYVVSKDYSAEEVADLLPDLQNRVLDEGINFIEGDFDILAGAVKNFHSLNLSHKNQSWRCIYDATYLLWRDLKSDSSASSTMDRSEKSRLCNTLKMSLYIFCSLIGQFEERNKKTGPSVQAAAEAAMTKGRGKKATQKKSDETYDWEGHRDKGISLLLQISILPLQHLFTPPIVDESFINMTTKCCYTILENGTISKMEKSMGDRLRENIFHIIANAVARHNHSFNFCLKVIQLLQSKDHLIKDLASLIQLMVKDHEQKIIVQELINEIERVDMNKDSSGTRAIAEFLTEIAERCPDAVLLASSTLIQFLDLDAYMIRNAVLSAIGSIVSLCLSSSEASEHEKKLRDDLLDKLEDHIHDLTTFTRGRAINEWAKLCKEGKIPLLRMDSLVGKIVGRLKDKSVYVRKAAVKFLTDSLLFNRFALPLFTDELSVKLSEESSKLSRMLATRSNSHVDGEVTINVEPAESENDTIIESENDTILERDAPQNSSQKSSSQSLCRSHVIDDEEVTAQRKVVRYLVDCVRFAQHIRSAVPLVCSMLNSANIGDSKEAIDFFVTAHQFGVKEAISGIRRTLLLVFSQDKAVQKSVVDAFKHVYLDSNSLDSLSNRQRCHRVVKCLIDLVEDAAVGELLALEEILQHLLSSGDIESEHIKILFEKFAMKQPDVTAHQSRLACKLICMLASADKELVIQNLDTFVTIGLGQRADEDTRLVQLTCATLSRAADSNPKVEEMKVAFRLDQNHAIFSRLHGILVRKIYDQNDAFYLPMSHEAIKVIYKLAEHPDQICEKIVKDILILLERRSHVCDKENEGSNTDAGTRESDTTDEVADFDIPSHVLCRFFTITGNIALNQLIFVESSVLTEVKIRKLITETKQAVKLTQRRTRRASAAPKSRKILTPENAEEEIGLAGASAVEDELEHFRLFRIIDDPQNLLAQIAPLVVHVVSHPQIYSDLPLQNAATMAMAKFMCISQKFCQDNLQLLFTVSSKAEEPMIRQNVIIALGDLCLRYPNLLDPWTSHLYRPLNDPDVNVRKNTIKVLSRLILSDMVKAKGQISEMAKLIVDEDNDLSSLARVFFDGFKKRENAIYNILPDIISHLTESNEKEQLDEKKCQEILKFFLKMIEKDRQTQCLVEKLCHRFRATTNERQWRDLIFCLCQLEYTERSLLKIYENYSSFASKIACDAVYYGLVSIIEKGKKLPLKNEAREQIHEFEKKIEKLRVKKGNA